jgi:hypothetical protein
MASCFVLALGDCTGGYGEITRVLSDPLAIPTGLIFWSRDQPPSESFGWLKEARSLYRASSALLIFTVGAGSIAINAVDVARRCLGFFITSFALVDGT